MSHSLGVGLQHLLPHRLLCAFIYRVARCRQSWFKSTLIRWFAHQYGVKMSEAERPDLSDYASFNDFFTRALKPGARPIDPQPDSLVSPVDGKLTQFGTLRGDRLIQAKGMDYSLHDLLGENSPATAQLLHGEFATIYLAPHNYHRIHTPLAGRWIRTRYLPGDRFSVNEQTAAAIRGLFCRNERLVCWFESAAGPFAVVFVGALNVSSMSTVTCGEIASGPPRNWAEDSGAVFAKGAEIGRFNLGSTVVFLAPRGTLQWNADIAPNRLVVMGEPLAQLTRGH
jgi:phosphatidylserine decarboxylase